MTAMLIALAFLVVAIVVRVAVAIWSLRRDEPLSAAWRDEHAGKSDHDAA